MLQQNSKLQTKPAVFNYIRSWIHQIEIQLEKIDESSPLKQQNLKKEILHQLNLQETLAFVTELEKISQGFRTGIVHADLTPLNIVLVKNAESEGLLQNGAFLDGKLLSDEIAQNLPLRFIDYEYCAVNLLAFDVANHFCEVRFPIFLIFCQEFDLIFDVFAVFSISTVSN